MQRGLREMPRLTEGACRLSVQEPPPSATSGLVDDVADERMLDLVPKLAGAFVLDHNPLADQFGEDRPDFLERSSRECGQITERNRSAHDRHQLEHLLRCRLQAAQLRYHALGQALR